MNTTESQAISPQPKLIETFRAGFNIAANHLYLLMFPLALDLWIWFGLHLSMRRVLSDWLAQLSMLAAIPSERLDEFTRTAQEVLIERFNLMTALRSYPVGIPSLMSSRLPVQTPIGQPVGLDLLSLQAGVGWFIGLSLAGLALGTFYYQVVAQAALNGQPGWTAALRNWPHAFWQVFCLALVWLGIILLISVPFSCLIPVLAVGGISQFALFIYLVVLAWLFFPLILSAHSIFVYRDKMTVSVIKSIQLTRLTMPGTTLFILVSFLVTQGLDIIWRWPVENSFLVFIGLAGHAFVTTGILAASFIYFRDADQWVQRFLRQVFLRQQTT